MIGDPTRISSPEASAVSGEVATPRRALLGEMLVESGVITPEQLGEVLSVPRVAGKKLGQVLLERGWITEAQLTQTLSLQLSVPWVSLNHIDFSRQLLNRVAREVAEKYCLIPIFVRHVKGQGETLYVAMDDPTNENALQEAGHLAGLPARPMIASASDIRRAIRVYYGEPAREIPILDVPAPPTRIEPPVTAREGRGNVGEHVTPSAPATQPEPPRSQPPPPPPSRRSQPDVHAFAHGDELPPSTRRSSPPTSGVAAMAAPEEAAPPSSAPTTPAQETEPPVARRKPPRMLNLTLLDGTTIQVPTGNTKKAEGAALTARDIISALRATAHGADASEILGQQVKWEPIVAALLSVLLRKGLITDFELVEELKKI